MDDDCLPVDITQITEAIEENVKPWRSRLQCARVERKEAKMRNFFRFLSVRQ
jgi:hypothetical protein